MSFPFDPQTQEDYECINCGADIEDEVIEEMKWDTYDPPVKLCLSCGEG